MRLLPVLVTRIRYDDDDAVIQAFHLSNDWHQGFTYTGTSTSDVDRSGIYALRGFLLNYDLLLQFNQICAECMREPKYILHIGGGRLDIDFLEEKLAFRNGHQMSACWNRLQSSSTWCSLYGASGVMNEGMESAPPADILGYEFLQVKEALVQMNRQEAEYRIARMADAMGLVHWTNDIMANSRDLCQLLATMRPASHLNPQAIRSRVKQLLHYPDGNFCTLMQDLQSMGDGRIKVPVFAERWKSGCRQVLIQLNDALVGKSETAASLVSMLTEQGLGWEETIRQIQGLVDCAAYKEMFSDLDSIDGFVKKGDPQLRAKAKTLVIEMREWHQILMASVSRLVN